MNKNLLLVGLGAVILIAAGILYFKDTPEPIVTNQPATTTPRQQQQAGTSTPQNGTDQGGEGMDIGGSVDIGGAPDAVISFTANGFEPSTVTIQKGDTVRFVNNSTLDIWPASANHPTHTVYPQKSADDCLGSTFDACKAVKPGESWDFTFTEVGTWNFHDHLHSNRRGSVTVTQ